MKDKWILQSTEKSFCSECGKNLDLLCKEFAKGPMFFICFSCRRVFQAGTGEVKREAF